MSLPWSHRKQRLAALLKNTTDDEDQASLALDRVLHGHSVIGKTAKSIEVDSIRFKDSDLQELGALEAGQFGVVHVVQCHLDQRVYVRKSIDKTFVMRNRDHVQPLHERLLLLRATKQDIPWVPHLLAAFQTPTHLNLVMDYIEGGSLADVLESAPAGRIEEQDLRWWAPQIITAITWCHEQGFVHRDIKPQNVLVSPSCHAMLIDFGSSAPLLPPASDGSQTVPKNYCVVPVGTCDYISPEILRKGEEAIVRMEMEDDSSESEYKDPYADDDEDSILNTSIKSEGYGRETDWWSFGVMLYELVYGTAPFFAPDIRQTYAKIVNHENSLKFPSQNSVSGALQDFLGGLLCNHLERLGRFSVQDIMDHAFFRGVNWDDLADEEAHADLHLPQFVYSDPAEAAASAAQQFKKFVSDPLDQTQEPQSRAFAFSALFQSSAEIDPGVSQDQVSVRTSNTHRSILSASSLNMASISPEDAAASFIGFSWGPLKDAFDDVAMASMASAAVLPDPQRTPMPTRLSGASSLPKATPRNFLGIPSDPIGTTPRPRKPQYPYATPLRPSTIPSGANPAITPFRTLPPSAMRNGSSGLGMTAQRKRAYSEREALQQMINCVGMSARKKVLESGRKPRLLTRSFDYGKRVGELDLGGGGGGGSSPWDDDPSPDAQAQPAAGRAKKLALQPVNIQPRADSSQGRRRKGSSFGASAASSGPSFMSSYAPPIQRRRSSGSSLPVTVPSASESETEASMPPSPSPSPRPGSAMSRASGWGRSTTPMLFNATTTLTQSQFPTPSISSRVATDSRYAQSFRSSAMSEGRSDRESGSMRRDSSTIGNEESVFIDEISSSAGSSSPTISGRRHLAEVTSEDLNLDYRHAKLMDDITMLDAQLSRLLQAVGEAF